MGTEWWGISEATVSYLSEVEFGGESGLSDLMELPLESKVNETSLVEFTSPGVVTLVKSETNSTCPALVFTSMSVNELCANSSVLLFTIKEKANLLISYVDLKM